jgi:hypothetical protein
MRLICLAALLVAQVFGQVEKTVEQLEAEKRDPKKKAVVLLDNAGQAVGTARPEVQVFGLLHLAENYEPIDKKKSLEYFHQAFDAASSVPADSENNQRGQLQAEIVRSLATLNVDDAIAMLRQMEPTSKNDSRINAAQSIIVVLIQKKRLDDALEIVGNFGTFGDYPYAAAGSIFKALPADDPRRSTLFSSAMAAYGAHPRGNFPDLLVKVWREIPQSLAQSAVTTLVNGILDRKDDDSHFSGSISSIKGTANFGSRKDYDLFNLMSILQTVDPKRAAEILEARPDLKTALKQFPEGTESMRENGQGGINSSTSSGRGRANPQQDAEQRLAGLARNRAELALDALKEDPDKAMSIAKTIPVASFQADVLGKIANSVGEKDPGSAKGILGQCVSMLDDIKDPSDRVNTWTIVAEAGHKIKDDKLSWQAIDRAMADATALYRLDADEDSPNKALREYWPSTQAYRRIVMTAAKLFGVDAEPLLLRISDPDLALLARVEMAQALLERPHDSWSTSVSRSAKK